MEYHVKALVEKNIFEKMINRWIHRLPRRGDARSGERAREARSRAGRVDGVRGQVRTRRRRLLEGVGVQDAQLQPRARARVRCRARAGAAEATGGDGPIRRAAPSAEGGRGGEGEGFLLCAFGKN